MCYDYYTDVDNDYNILYGTSRGNGSARMAAILTNALASFRRRRRRRRRHHRQQ